MKKILFSTLLLGVAFFGNAQSTAFKPFKFDFAVGYGIPAGSGSSAGVILALEPKYSINNNITLGLRFEGAVLAKASYDANTGVTKADAHFNASYLATGDYFFNTNSFRPFVGLGVGLFNSVAAAADNTGTAEASVSTNKFGAAPRVGFEAGHFRMGVEYNIAGKSGSINNNYLGIKIGFFVGGGKTSSKH